MKNYDEMTALNKEHFLAHSSVELVHSLYHSSDRKGLETFLKNFEYVTSYARDCLECLDILDKKGDVFNKIFLLIDHVGQGGITEDFVNDMKEIADKAQFTYEHEGEEPSEDEINSTLTNLRKVMARYDKEAEQIC